MTDRQALIIRDLHGLYEWHDRSEMALIRATRRKAWPSRLRGMWKEHDELERSIIHLEAKLPDRLVKQLKEGRL
jgi:hypothetical protein